MARGDSLQRWVGIVAVLLIPTSGWSQEDDSWISMRGWLSAGVGSLEEEEGGLSPGLKLQYGLGFWDFFAEYSFYWLKDSLSPNFANLGISSPMGVTLGWSPARSIWPGELSVGIESSRVLVRGDSAEGTEQAIGAQTLVFGGAWRFLQIAEPNEIPIDFGLRAEFRRSYLNAESGGQTPDSSQSPVQSVWFALTLGANLFQAR